MKIFPIFASLVILLLLNSFVPSQPGAILEIQATYELALSDFQDLVERYSDELHSGRQDAAVVRKYHKRTRMAWKKVEHFAAFFEDEFVKFHINGAPLARTEFKNGKLRVINAEGLQLLDELVAEDRLDYEAMQNRMRLLEHRVASLVEFEIYRNFDESRVFTSMRKQLLRIASMGITGFDTPGTQNALEESLTSLQSLQDVFAFEAAGHSMEETPISQSINENWRKAIEYLADNQDFEAFDRLVFIKDYLNPIYRQLLVFQKEAGIPSFNERTSQEQAINFEADNLFSADFLNPYYFAHLKEKEDSPEMRELGALLFYDPVLSYTNTVSCGSCHQPDLAFTDGRKKSLSSDAISMVERNAPTLLNSVYSMRFFYDLRANKLETQTNGVIENPSEFHTDFTVIAEKLKESEEYNERFEEAFSFADWSATKIDQYTISTALTSYVLSLRDMNSPFDRYMRGDSDQLKKGVKEGFNLFMGKAACATCHFPPTFSGLVPPGFHENETEVLGVPVDKEYSAIDPDQGRINSCRPQDNAAHYRSSFKTMSVRNIDRTAPYMHNGVFETLEEVVEFYDIGGGAGAGLDVPHQTLASDSLHLAEEEKAALVAFMKSLSDDSFKPDLPKRLPSFPKESVLSDVPRKVRY